MSDIFRDIALSFVRVHVLHHASQGPVYGLEMMEELARHGYKVGPGTMYPVLHGLEQAGYLKRRDLLVDGHTRKTYRITAAGRRALRNLLPKIRELLNEVLESID